MIYEYAVSPQLVAHWAMHRIGRMVGQFGMDQRRLVADFPKDWKGEAYGALLELCNFDYSSLENQNASPTMDAYLQILGDTFVCRTTPQARGDEWLPAALNEHAQRPFHAILVEKATHDNPAVITPAVMEDVRDVRWYLPTVSPSKKTAEELVFTLAPLMVRARTVILVDPYFDSSEERFTSVLRLLLQVAVVNREEAIGMPKVVVMTGVEKAHSPRDGEFTEQQKRNVVNDLVNKARTHLPSVLPAGVELEFVCLAHPIGGDPLHNRYLLTDVGGAVMPFGADARGTETTDDVQPMQKGIYQARWNQYAKRQNLSIVLAGEMILPRSAQQPLAAAYGRR